MTLGLTYEFDVSRTKLKTFYFSKSIGSSLSSSSWSNLALRPAAGFLSEFGIELRASSSLAASVAEISFSIAIFLIPEYCYSIACLILAY